MANYFHMVRIAMLCAERNIRAYTRVEGDTQTVRLGIFPAEPEHYAGSLADWLKVEPTPVPTQLEQNIRELCDLDRNARLFNWAGCYSANEFQFMRGGEPCYYA